jgi:hypothetical protein
LNNFESDYEVLIETDYNNKVITGLRSQSKIEKKWNVSNECNAGSRKKKKTNLR